MDRRTFLTATSVFCLSATVSSPVFANSRSGTFSGQSGHTVSGGVRLQNGEIILASDFDFDGAPDPRIALGKGGKFSKGTDFAKLRKDKGSQTYKVPASISPDDYDTIIVWCRKFSVPLAQAKIR